MECVPGRRWYHVPLVFEDFDLYFNGYRAHPDRSEERNHEVYTTVHRARQN